MNRFFTMLFVVFVSVSLFGQSPTMINYQGVARDLTGSPIQNKNIGLRISLLRSSATGIEAYKELHQINTGNLGLFNIQIGNGTPISGSIGTIDWGNGPYYLRIEMDENGGSNYQLMGTNQILSVPYALYAKTAGNGFSGNYNDLSNKPALFDGSWINLTNKPSLFNGNYSDLTNKPTLFDGTWSSLSGKPSFAKVSASGNYNDLTDRPLLFDGTWVSLKNKPTTVLGYGIKDAATKFYVDSISKKVLINGTNLGDTLTIADDVDVFATGDGYWNPYVNLPIPNTSNNFLIKRKGTYILIRSKSSFDFRINIKNTDLTERLVLKTGESALFVFDGARWLIFGHMTVNKFIGNYNDLTNKPTTISGYGITDAVKTSGDQTITGIKTFTNDLLVNGLSVGMGKGTVSSNTAIGFQSLYSNTIGNYSTAIGYQSLRSNKSGYDNTAIGYLALNSNIQGTANTAQGTSALQSNTTGNANTATGRFAMSSNTSGSQNVAIGSDALHSNTIGSFNTSIGFESMQFNLAGHSNVANGYQALYSNTSGNNNTAMGLKSLYSNTTGEDNTANGYETLFSNTTGAGNTSVGYIALYSNTTGINNTAIGNRALYSNTTGNWNSAISSNTLFSNTTGIYNTASGFQALYLNTTGNHNTGNGNGALLTNTTGSYNTANGSGALYYNVTGYQNTANGYNALSSNTTGLRNTANGSSALFSNTIGNFNTANGFEALLTNTTGSYNTAIGYKADMGNDNLTNATAIGNGAIVNASNKIVLGNSSATTVGGYGAWSNYSDRRLKENIIYNNDLGLNFISKLKTASYNYISDKNKRRRDGLIAQDVQQILKDLNVEFSGIIVDDDKDKTLNLSYGDFVIPLINSVQEQQKLIAAQQKQIDELKKMVEKLMQH